MAKAVKSGGGQLIEDATRKTIFLVDPRRLTIIGLDTDDGPEHYAYDPRANDPIDPAMIASIRDIGVQQTCKVVVEKDDRIVVIDGRQRTKNARAAMGEMKVDGEAGWDALTVPCYAEKLGEIERLLVMGVALNEIRRDDSIMVKAAKAQRMLDQGITIARVAVSFGVSMATIRNWIASLALAAPVKKAIEQGAITVTAAAKWSDMPKADQVAALARAVSESGGKRVSVSKATRTVNPDAPVKPSKKIALAAIEAMPGAFADGIRFALGLLPEDERPDAVAALFETQEVSQ